METRNRPRRFSDNTGKLPDVAALLTAAVMTALLLLMMWVNKEEKALFIPAGTETVQLFETIGTEEKAAVDTGVETGGNKGLAAVLTALFPFSGCDLWLVCDEGMEISTWGVTLIMVKNAVWFALATVLMTNRRGRRRRAVR